MCIKTQSKVRYFSMTILLTFCLSLLGKAYKGTLNEPVISIAVSFTSKLFLVGTEGILSWVGVGIGWEKENWEISRGLSLKILDGGNCFVNEDSFLFYRSVSWSAAMKCLKQKT